MNFSLESPDPETLAAEAERIRKTEERRRLAELAERPLTGGAGDLTADMFGAGDTSLFNERRDQ